jgi:4-hydroxy-3-methylbut-2-enyl diphosphate reductase
MEPAEGRVAMRVLRAEALGLCFGVRDALTAARAVADPSGVTIHGELVHNEHVLRELADRGFRSSPEDRREAPGTAAVLVTAHGISERERARLLAAGKRLIDTTCPLVSHVHRAAQELQAEGRYVVVIGKRGHVEVRGIVDDLERSEVVSAPEDARCYGHGRIGVVCQTTVPIGTARQVLEAIQARNPEADVCFRDTVCAPTKRRQAALEELLARVDAMVVVGGRNSNNTRQLVAACERARVRALHVQAASDVEPAWFAGCRVVGLTAGTSTLDATVDEVERALASIPADEEQAT